MSTIYRIENGRIHDRREDSPTLLIVGPTTGMPDGNAAAFEAAAQQLRAAGFHVVSPIEQARAAGSAPSAAPLRGKPARDALQRDVRAACDADGIVLLEGWHYSARAKALVAVADALGTEAQSAQGWLDRGAALIPLAG